jgi:Predicted membrane protein
LGRAELDPARPRLRLGRVPVHRSEPAFSLQAAYAAPLILLAQTRQADRDKLHSERIDKSHSRLEHSAKTETDKVLALLQSNTELTLQDKQLTEQVADLTKQIHALLLEQRA